MFSHLIFGCGYLGERVARRWVAAGHAVAALTRRPERAELLAAAGITPILGDVLKPQSLAPAKSATTILFAVGHDARSVDSLNDVYVKGLANVLDSLGPQVQRLVYISSTGVYGQTDGRWIDETAPAIPQRSGGKAHLAAEELLGGSALAARSVVLRCAGLYGPGRIPRLDDLRQGKPIAAAPDVYLNLIHIDDAAAATCAAAEHAAPSRLYLVSDGEPVLRRDFYGEIARRLQLAPPTFVPPADAASRRAGGDNKRINSERMLRELSVPLQFPDYRAGLAAIL
jgi:nucleoside-diphosphate-sugar epimerase